MIKSQTKREVFIKKTKPYKNLKININNINCIYKKNNIIMYNTNTNKINSIINMLYYKNNKIFFKNNNRGGLIHRLDKDTKGILLIKQTKNLIISENIKNFKKTYLTITKNKIKKHILIKGYNFKYNNKILKKKLSYKYKYTKTICKRLAILYVNNKIRNLCTCKIKNGQFHQIRKHLTHINTPIINYKNKTHKIKYLLNAFKIKLNKNIKIKYLHDLYLNKILIKTPILFYIK